MVIAKCINGFKLIAKFQDANDLYSNKEFTFEIQVFKTRIIAFN